MKTDKEVVEEMRNKWHLWHGVLGGGRFTTCGAEVEEYVTNLRHQDLADTIEEVEKLPVKETGWGIEPEYVRKSDVIALLKAKQKEGEE